MVEINIVSVGNLKEKYWKDAIAEYQKRLSAFAKVNIIEVKESVYGVSLAEIEKAKRELANFGCEVVVKVINQMKKPQKQVIKEITRIVNIERQKGLDGITTFVGFSDLVPVLNN